MKVTARTLAQVRLLVGLKGPRRFNPAALAGLGVLSRLWPWPRPVPLYRLPAAHSTPNRS